MALSNQQLGAAMGLGLPWLQVNYPPASGNAVDDPGLYIAAGTFPVIVLIDEPPAIPLPQVIIPFSTQSRVGAVNHALTTMLGEDRIESFDDDSKAASLAKTNFDRILDQELSRHRWAFAIERRKVAASSDTAWGPWKYSYQPPADLLTLLWAGPHEPSDYAEFDPEGLWAVEGGFIRTNFGAPLPLVYIKRVAEPGLWHPLFFEALAARIGMKMAIPITQDQDKWELCEHAYKEAIREARRANAIQSSPRSTAVDPWLTARH